MDNIELRSEKVRNIIGQIPPLLTRIGTVVIIFIIIALVVASCLIHYPITTEADGKIVQLVNGYGEHYYTANLMLPYKDKRFYHEPREVAMTFEGYENFELRGSISGTAYNKIIVLEDGDNYCLVKVRIKEEDIKRYNLQPGMKVHGISIVDNRTIWQLLFERSPQY